MPYYEAISTYKQISLTLDSDTHAELLKAFMLKVAVGGDMLASSVQNRNFNTV